MLIIPFIGFFLASSFQKYLLLDDRVIASMVDGKLVPGEARKHPSNPGIVTNYPPFFRFFCLFWDQRTFHVLRCFN